MSSQDDPDRPDVHLKAMSVGLVKQDLGRDIIWCSAYCPSTSAAAHKAFDDSHAQGMG